MGWKSRFVPAAAGKSTGWAEPTVTLGLRAHRRETRMFVVPEGFMDELPPLKDDEDPAPDQRVFEWLVAKGLMVGDNWEDLPEITYDPAKGYGWRPFSYEVIQYVLLKARAKADGTPGLWLSAFADDLAHYHPVLSRYDTVAAEIGRGTRGASSACTPSKGRSRPHTTSSNGRRGMSDTCRAEPCRLAQVQD